MKGPVPGTGPFRMRTNRDRLKKSLDLRLFFCYIVSMHRNKTDIRNADTGDLIRTFARITDEKTMRKFLGEILTRSEITDLTLRWKLMKMLKSKIPQRKIASELGISLCKITRGAKVLKDPGAVANRYIQPSDTRRSDE
jgi:TrpR family transcriptional regulator, trp operon repressor